MPGNSGWTIRPAAEADLVDIWLKGATTWGVDQAERYADGPFALFDLLAEFPENSRGRMLAVELEKALARNDLTEMAGHLGGVLEGTRRMTRIINSLKKSADRPRLMHYALGHDVLRLEDDATRED